MRSRQVCDEDDYERVRDLLRRLYAADGPPDYCALGDLDWWRHTQDDPAAIRQARVWLDDAGDAVGFAWPSDGRLDHFARPDYRDLEPELVAWAEGVVRAGGHATLTAFAYDSHD